MKTDTFLGYPVRYTSFPGPAYDYHKVVLAPLPQPKGTFAGKCPMCSTVVERAFEMPERTQFEQFDHFDCVCPNGHEFVLTMTRTG